MMKSKNRNKWLAATNSELQSHVTHNTFSEVTKIENGFIALGSRWIFSLKLHPDGSILRFKARLVLQGYRQRKGIDYKLTSSPVCKMQSVRILLLLAAKFDLELTSMDVSTAYLNADIKDTIYMKIPPGYIKNSPETKYLKLEKALYGGKQSGRRWYERITTFLKSKGYKQLKSDSCIFCSQDPTIKIYICIYVDDILIAGTTDEVDKFKNMMYSEFKMTEIPVADKFIGLEINRNRKTKKIHLSQNQYVKELLEKFNLNDLQPCSIPADPNKSIHTRYLDPPDEKEIAFMKTINFRSMIGGLLWLLNTRMEIAAAVNQLCPYVTSPRKIHYDAICQIFAYLKYTLNENYGTLITSNNESESVILDCFTDANWASDIDTRRSKSGILLRLDGSTIITRSHMQPTIAQSSTGAELISANDGAKDIVWARQFLQECNFPQLHPTILSHDNAGSIAISENDTLAKVNRHLDVKLLWLRELVANNIIGMKYVKSSEMIADALTKILPRPPFERFRQLIGITPLSTIMDT